METTTYSNNHLHPIYMTSFMNVLYTFFRAYIGPSPASEPETMSVVNYTKTVLANKTVAAITFHSFGEVFFVPYAHNNSIPVNIKVNVFLLP